MHTILGAGGPISNALTQILAKQPEKVRLISRRPVQTSGNMEWVQADVLNFSQLRTAVQGSKVIYLVVGLIYDKKIWREQWPVVMENAIKVTKETGARLIFFDNVYCYGRVNGPMTEATEYNPCSVKGEIRARIATKLMDEVKAGNIQASIGRAADFYGATNTMNSFFDQMVLAKYAKREKAMWLGDPQTLHAFTYVPDAAYALYLLGQQPASDNQIWHLPTDRARKGLEFLKIAADAFSTAPSYMKINQLMLRLYGMFNQPVKGTVEMYYQYDSDYNFSSAKFEREFEVKPTSYEAGIAHLAETFYR